MSDRIDPTELPEVRAWITRLVPPPGWLAFLSHKVGLEGAIVVARLIWPQFIEIKGCVVIAGLRSEAEVGTWWEHTGGDIPRIEAVLGVVHLWDVFPDNATTGVEAAALVELGHVMAESWSAVLQRAFPDRVFLVGYADDPDEHGPTVWYRSST